MKKSTIALILIPTTAYCFRLIDSTINGFDFFSIHGFNLQDIGAYFMHFDVLYYLISALATGILFWYVFLRAQCPVCGTGNFHEINLVELDRWIGPTKVQDRDGNGKIVNRTVSVTKLEMERTSRCFECGHKWKRRYKTEKH